MNAGRIDSEHFMQQPFNKKCTFLACHAIIQTILIRTGRSCHFFRQFNYVRCQFTAPHLFVPVESTFVSLLGPYDTNIFHLGLLPLPIAE